MLQAMAYGGTLGTSLFKNAIAASPYLPMQYGYKDWVPSQSYYAFAGLANCMPNTAYGSSARTIFECLVNQDTQTLQYASFNVSASGTFGTWGFLPVTDGVFIQDVPSQQLLEKKVNGENLLVGNNANEGPLFVPQTIDTEADLVAWLELTFPLFSNDDIARILRYCKSPPTLLLTFHPSRKTNTKHPSQTPAPTPPTPPPPWTSQQTASQDPPRSTNPQSQAANNSAPTTSTPKPPSCAPPTGCPKPTRAPNPLSDTNTRCQQPNTAPTYQDTLALQHPPKDPTSLLHS